MKDRILICGIILACSLFFGLSAAFADGIIIIEPPIHPHVIRHRPIPTAESLPIKYHRVLINIDNQIATTSIDQVFKNDYDVDLEGTYIFPLPDDATITDFAMYVDGKRTSGEILDKNKARQIYEDIVRRMKDPGLLEYSGRNMFKARVYPIPKHGEKRIELIYQQTLKYDAGLYKYVYPLNTERFSPKPLEEVTISAKIKSKVPIKSLYSPSHEVDTKVEQFQASCGYEAKDVKPDKDFVLYYTVSEKDVGLNLLSYRNPGEDGYFIMLLSPGQIENRTISKDIIFVLDTSGSMRGHKIKQAKDALRFCINRLGKGDRFNVIRFATDVSLYKDSLVIVNNKNIKGVLDFVDEFEARGGTNINNALLSSIEMFTDSKRPRMIVFLTDGEPTVGVTDMKDIVKNLTLANKSKTRIFVFGVGNNVNSHLLDRIVEAHRGISEYVAYKENIEDKVSSFYRKISEPILSDIKLNFGKIKMREGYPLTLPDIFRGSQLVLFGRYEGDGATAITLTGYVDGKEKRFVYEDRFPVKNKENDFIPRIWATRKIGYLMNEIRLKGENKELVDEIIRLSKEHGIMTPYTSFLILEKEADYKQWGITHSNADEMKRSGRKYKMAMEMAVGEESVARARDISALKKRETAGRPALETVKHAGDKTFYLRDNVWVDSKYTEDIKAKEIKYLSEKYFDILRQKPGLGKYFAIAKNIIIIYEKECYRITE